MSGTRITDQQVRLYMNNRKHHPQKLAAAKSGMSERTARRVEHDAGLPSQQPRRYWRSRPDPFADVWESEIVPLLRSSPKLKATTCSSPQNKFRCGFAGKRLMKIHSALIARAVELAVDDGNSVSEVSERWTRVDQVVVMSGCLTRNVREQIECDLPSLRYWNSPATPHNLATEGFISDAEAVGLLFPVA